MDVVHLFGVCCLLYMFLLLGKVMHMYTIHLYVAVNLVITFYHVRLLLDMCIIHITHAHGHVY